jgi:hypothetical protein
MGKLLAKQNRRQSQSRRHSTNRLHELSVEKGTAIKATRDYKPLEFYGIVEKYLGLDAGKAALPNKTVGDWGKFIRTNIKNQKTRTRRTYTSPKKVSSKLQQKRKSGRGWLHTKILKKSQK